MFLFKPGTGKTAAFGIGTLSRIDYGNKNCQALLLAPTRELAIQIQKVCLSLGDYVKVCGGLPAKIYFFMRAATLEEDPPPLLAFLWTLPTGKRRGVGGGGTRGVTPPPPSPVASCFLTAPLGCSAR